ncbi:Putative toxin-antitoxin system, toxin component, type II BrnT [Desulfonema limicola]|uniref:Toxin-antitoxin system, toxin component, type II BrnT n=1 Tax=Desulfonema limicola TaxID=45656 RepID=A0A975GGF8_9BACT|nr:BrnT family toxin [Desulfonema limicola]QTA80276.1 Putative toxin-antitoxin system, toxin component, type II BrnT [Desulfonema limicola]
MKFEWDENKNLENIKKHGISFEISQKAFLDAHRIIAEDIKHSNENEKRYFCFGKIDNDIITVRFTIRDKNIRIFGSGIWREGRKKYEEKNQL